MPRLDSKDAKNYFKSRTTRITLLSAIFAIMFLFTSPSVLVSAYDLQSNHSPLSDVNVLPNTPKAAGCYQYVAAQSSWKSVPCLSASASAALPRPTEGGKSGVTGEASKHAFYFGYVAVRPGPVYGESDSVRGANAFSVQENTNGFVFGGVNYAVQITIQNTPSSNNFCIWQNDVTHQIYNNNCMSVPAISNINTNTLDYLYLDAFSVGYLSAQFCLDSKTNCYYLSSVPDQYGLTANKWIGLTGTILGYGGGSKATFFNSGTGAKPIVDVHTGIYKPYKQFISGEIGAGTVETNNLVYTKINPITCSGGWCASWEDSN